MKAMIMTLALVVALGAMAQNNNQKRSKVIIKTTTQKNVVAKDTLNADITFRADTTQASIAQQQQAQELASRMAKTYDLNEAQQKMVYYLNLSFINNRAVRRFNVNGRNVANHNNARPNRQQRGANPNMRNKANRYVQALKKIMTEEQFKAYRMDKAFERKVSNNAERSVMRGAGRGQKPVFGRGNNRMACHCAPRPMCGHQAMCMQYQYACGHHMPMTYQNQGGCCIGNNAKFSMCNGMHKNGKMSKKEYKKYKKAQKKMRKQHMKAMAKHHKGQKTPKQVQSKIFE